MSETIRHDLPLLAAGQAQKEITHNEALLAIDRLLQLSVVSRVVNVPPGAPVPGEIHIVAVGATGAWAGRTGQLAMHDGFGWTFVQPIRGCLAWIADEQVFAIFHDGWSTHGWPVASLRVRGRQVLAAAPVAVAAPAGGTTIDTESRSVLSQVIVALRDQGIIL